VGNWLAKLSVKPLLYVIGVLLVALATTWMVQSARVTVAQSARDVAQAQLSKAGTEREAWKLRANELKQANAAFKVTVGTLQLELKGAQDQAVVMRQQNDAALASAKAAVADADRTLQAFMTRYQTQARVADCAKALLQVEATCPAFSGY
jgi:hypothetical protein